MAARESRRTPKSPRKRRVRRSGGARRAASKRPRVDRRAWVIAAALAVVLVAAFPPARRVAARAWAAARDAVAAARAEDARDRLVARYAVRYGIEWEMSEAIVRAAQAERVDAELAFRLVRVESGFHVRAVSPVGAIGLTQLMPATAAELQPGITRDQMFDRDTNLRLGLRYFRYLLRYYDGNTEEALHAYNRGMGTVARIRASGGDPANGYARHVLGERGASPVRRTPPAAIDTTAAAVPSHELGPARLPSGL